MPAALKAGILAVYAALPTGALLMGSHDLRDSSGENIYESIAEASGWNEILDQVCVVEICVYVIRL